MPETVVNWQMLGAVVVIVIDVLLVLVVIVRVLVIAVWPGLSKIYIFV